MAKFIIIMLLLTVSVAVMSAPSLQEYKPLKLQGEEFKVDTENENHLRHRRVTCDLFGFTGDSACATHCLSMGKAVGTCNAGVCVCRQDNLKDLLDKKFPPEEGPDQYGRFRTNF